MAIAQLIKGIGEQQDALKNADLMRRLGFKRAIKAYKGVPESLKYYNEFGKSNLSLIDSYLKDPSKISEMPGYQFKVDQGVRTITNERSGVGKLFSGETLKELTSFGQELATSEYDKELNRLFSAQGLAQGGEGMFSETSLNLADLYAGQGQAAAKRYEDTSAYISGHEARGSEFFASSFGSLMGMFSSKGSGGGGGKVGGSYYNASAPY